LSGKQFPYFHMPLLLYGLSPVAQRSFFLSGKERPEAIMAVEL